MDTLIQLYKQHFGTTSESITPLDSAGSGRKYYRINGNHSVIGTIGTSKRENEAFFYLAKLFEELDLPTPRVLSASSDSMTYIQDDLGSQSLFNLIATKGCLDNEVTTLLHKIMSILPHFHYRASQKANFSLCYPRSSMDKRAAMWDLNYFKYCFLKASGVEFDEDLLENDLQEFAIKVIANPDNTLMLRDFQSRNILIHNGEPFIIDFQGARRGSGLYDLASFLWQARVDYPQSLRNELALYYHESAQNLIGRPIPDFESTLLTQALFRTMQVLGAYGFRGYIEHKSMFLSSINKAIANLAQIIDNHSQIVPPYLLSILQQLVRLPQFNSDNNDNTLTVQVMSFSYKKGIPDDLSGNGGGFVFDCRALHNPGRYEQYKKSTGMDSNVIDFLDTQSDMPIFMDNCYQLVDPTVERYINRGFTHLMVCFGCTGGQHRSVYGAEHMAHHLSKKYGIRIRLIHREQMIDRIIQPQYTSR